jgi:uncharacterized phage protein (TIGR02220 family)
VNFYKHHLGDYDGATAHLSWDEDLAYRRLLNVYYRLEAPIPKDPGTTYRLVRAITKSQKEAVTSVLNEFFVELDDGWHNQRCDEEIAQFKIDNEQNQERRESEKERQRRHRDRRKNLFAGLREHGVTPPWDATVDELVAALERVQQCSNNAPVTRDITATHEPLTINHKPEEAKSIVRLAPDLRQQAREVLEFLNSKTGRHYEPVPANIELIVARLKEGASVDDLRAVVAKKTREWATDEKMSPYLRPATLFNRTKFAQYRGELGAAEPEKRMVI